MLATQYVDAFGDKWLGARRPADEEPIGSADIQSFADLGKSYGLVQDMLYGASLAAYVIMFTVAILVPVAPLLLTVMPLDEFAMKLIGVLI